MRTTVIVFPPPPLDDLPGLRQGCEPMHVQTLGPQRTVERLYVCVVGWLPGPGEVDPHLVVIRPQIHDLTGELRPVITEQELRNSALQPNVIQASHYILALQSLAHRDGQALSRKHIHHAQHMDRAPGSDRIVYEV